MKKLLYVFAILTCSQMFAEEVTPQMFEGMKGDIICLDKSVAFGDRYMTATKSKDCTFTVKSGECVVVELLVKEVNGKRDNKIREGALNIDSTGASVITLWDKTTGKFDDKNIFSIEKGEKGKILKGQMPSQFGGSKSASCITGNR